MMPDRTKKFSHYICSNVAWQNKERFSGYMRNNAASQDEKLILPLCTQQRSQCISLPSIPSCRTYFLIHHGQRSFFSNECGSLTLNNFVNELPITEFPATLLGLFVEPKNTCKASLIILFRCFVLNWRILHDLAS